jgi:hypothetical protein
VYTDIRLVNQPILEKQQKIGLLRMIETLNQSTITFKYSEKIEFRINPLGSLSLMVIFLIFLVLSDFHWQASLVAVGAVYADIKLIEWLYRRFIAPERKKTRSR